MPNAQEHLDYIARAAYLASTRYYVNNAWDLYDMCSADWEAQYGRVIPVGVASALYRACTALWESSHGLSRLPKVA